MCTGILESDERAWEGNAFFADDSAEAEGVRKELLAPSKGDGVFCRTAPADKQRIILCGNQVSHAPDAIDATLSS